MRKSYYFLCAKLLIFNSDYKLFSENMICIFYRIRVKLQPVLSQLQFDFEIMVG